MKQVFAITTMSALLFSGAAIAQSGTDAGTLKVDESFAELTLVRWTSGRGEYVARIKIINIDDKVALCGAGHLNGASVSNLTRDALKDLSLTLDGEPIISNFNYFERVRRKDDLATAQANCRVSDVPDSQIGPNSKFDLERGSRRYRVDG